MQWRGPESIPASRREGLGLELGVTIEFLVDDRLDAALGAELGQELTEDSITETVKALDLTAEPVVGHHLGCNCTNRPEGRDTEKVFTNKWGARRRQNCPEPNRSQRPTCGA